MKKFNALLRLLLVGALITYTLSAFSVTKSGCEYINQLITSADAGDLDAQLKIAKLYRSGSHEYQIRPRQINKAIKYYQLASDQGSTDADFQLGYLYYRQYPDFNDYEKAKYYFERASKNNHAEAQFFLASIYKYGYVGEKDLEMADHYYLLSGENGYSESYVTLAYEYEHGEFGRRIDYKKTIQYYELAARSGDKYSQASLAQIYLKGKITEKNTKKAKYWFSLSCKNGESSSCSEIKKLSLQE